MKVYVGERRMLRFIVEDVEGKDFDISNGQYTVECDGVVETSGTMSVDSHEISFLFTPTKAGMHKVIIFYDIGVEHIKAAFPIEVVE